MKTLIINIGPSGDLVRTTVLLRVLDGEIMWLTKESCKPFLKSEKISKVFLLENAEDMAELRKMSFDLIISLNEERVVLGSIKGLKSKKLIGVYLDDKNEVKYTPESAYWFDMSLVSRFGKKKADELKLKNKKSVPRILVEMVGKKWQGQEYDLGGFYQSKAKEIKGRVGLINVATGLWKNKLWAGYDSLAEKLKAEGHDAAFLGMRPSVEDHIKDILQCEVIICGDTLGMHLALAFRKKVVALFTCTSPAEIYDYGRMTKIISPKLKDFFYQKEFDRKAVEAIPIDEVYSAVKKLLNAKIPLSA